MNGCELHEIVRANDAEDRAHKTRESPTRGIVHDGGSGKLIEPAPSLNSAPSSREDVSNPLTISSIGERNEKSIGGLKSVYWRPVDSA